VDECVLLEWDSSHTAPDLLRRGAGSGFACFAIETNVFLLPLKKPGKAISRGPLKEIMPGTFRAGVVA